MAKAQATVFTKFNRPAAFACSLGATQAVARPITGTKSITKNRPNRSVGQAIWQKVTSGVKLIRQAGDADADDVVALAVDLLPTLS